MKFSITNDEVLYLYPYYSLNEKNDEMSKKVYHVFKKNWGTFFFDIRDDLFEAVEDFLEQNEMGDLEIAVTVMPSHSKGMHGENLLRVSHDLCKKFGFQDASDLIQRTIDKTKSTEGGSRTIGAHLETLGLDHEIKDNDADVYIVLDDITTTGSSLEAAKRLLVRNGVKAENIIKIAVAKTAHDDYF